MTAGSPRIAPSILSADFSRLGEEVKRVEQAGADWIHVDVMDGAFVPNITIGPLVVEAVRRTTELPLDVHLMIEKPERYVTDFVKAGASTVSVHVEACPHLHRSLAQIREAGARASVALNPATPASSVEAVLSEVDQLLVMTVNPGFGGQKFIEGSVDKVSRLRRRLDELRLSTELEVDGGVIADNAPRVVGAGANVLVAGAAVFNKNESVSQAIARLRESLRAFE